MQPGKSQKSSAALDLGAEELKHLKETARELRSVILRMITEAGSGHPGGSLSCIDILTALYFHVLRHRSQEPQWPLRDRFILSKGHGVPALYAVLAKSGYFQMSELMSLRKAGSRLQGHPVAGGLPGIEASTGSLGQGLSIAQGMAMAAKLDGHPYRVFCMLGDGETQEGQVWEAAMSAPKFHLDNLVAILDYNRGQIDGPTQQIMDLEPVADKWAAFNWHVQEIDGHDMKQILSAFDITRTQPGKPHIIIAHTTKGKGVSFMEHNIDWHGKAPTSDESLLALREIEALEIQSEKM